MFVYIEYRGSILMQKAKDGEGREYFRLLWHPDPDHASLILRFFNAKFGGYVVKRGLCAGGQALAIVMHDDFSDPNMTRILSALDQSAVPRMNVQWVNKAQVMQAAANRSLKPDAGSFTIAQSLPPVLAEIQRFVSTRRHDDDGSEGLRRGSPVSAARTPPQQHYYIECEGQVLLQKTKHGALGLPSVGYAYSNLSASVEAFIQSRSQLTEVIVNTLAMHDQPLRVIVTTFTTEVLDRTLDLTATGHVWKKREHVLQAVFDSENNISYDVDGQPRFRILPALVDMVMSANMAILRNTLSGQKTHDEIRATIDALRRFSNEQVVAMRTMHPSAPWAVVVRKLDEAHPPRAVVHRPSRPS